MEIAERELLSLLKLQKHFGTSASWFLTKAHFLKMTKHHIAVTVAHVTQCPIAYAAILRRLCEKEQANKRSWEAIWVADDMRAGGSYAHSALAIDEMELKEKSI